MKKVLLSIFCFLLMASTALAEDRFGRPVVRLKDPKAYEFTRLDDVGYPSISDDRYAVGCLVYRDIERYYVEISVTNRTQASITLPMDFISLDKQGFTVYRTDTMVAAQQAASAGGLHFIPVPAPYVPPSYHTTVSATATTYGDQTNVSATSRTTEDDSGQAGANLGNAIGNAIAAHRFYKAQRNDVALSRFLASHLQTVADRALLPGETRVIAATFEQLKQKRKDFDVNVTLGAHSFKFEYKE